MAVDIEEEKMAVQSAPRRDLFSVRAMRAFMSKIGNGLLSAAGYDWTEATDDEAEIARVVEHCASQREQNFKTSITDLAPCEGDESYALRDAEAGDPLLDQAIEIILRDQRASTSYLQRCLRIGYNRAANLVEEMEARGIVGPQIGSTPREILIET
jgi:hypothetical protein